MSSIVYKRIRENPKFRQLIGTRGRYAWTLALVVLTMFYGFVMMVAFMPASLGKPVAEGSMLTLGVALELFMFVFFWGLTATYVRRANTEFDAMAKQVIVEACQEN